MQSMKRGLVTALLLLMFFSSGGCRDKRQVYVSGLETHSADQEQSFGGEDSVQEQPSGAGSSVQGQPSGDAGTAEIPGTSHPAGYVYVCGAVCSPGVYPLHEGMRLFEAVALAGGFLPEADEEWLNQAEILLDGQRLYVYTKEETQEFQEQQSAAGIPAASQPGAASGMQGTSQPGSASGIQGAGNQPGNVQDDKVNINTADKALLMTLPGIGEVKAEAVIQYRESHGGFSSAEEIQEIPGIKNAVFLKIKDRITV